MRWMAMRKIEALKWAGVGLDDHPGLSASLGSWCSRGQTHVTPHVGEAETRARLCIFPKALQADFHSGPSLAAMLAEPSDGSRLTVTTVPVVWVVAAGAAAVS